MLQTVCILNLFSVVQNKERFLFGFCNNNCVGYCRLPNAEWCP